MRWMNAAWRSVAGRLRGGLAGPGRWELPLLLLVLGGAIWLRFYRLSAQSVWLDEAITWERASLPLPELFDDAVRRLHNPAYFTLMHYVLRVGDDELMLRLPSALFGALKMLAAAVLGQVVGGRRIAILTVLLLALSPQHLHYDQEARMYAWLTFALTIALAGLLWLVRHPDAARGPMWRVAGLPPSATHARRAWLAFILGTALGLYAHNTVVFFVFTASCVAALGALCVPTGRLRWLRNWTVANLLLLLLWSPWISYLLQQTKRIRERFWAKFPSPGKIEEILRDLYLFGSEHPAAVWAAGALTLLSLWALRRQRVLAGSLLLLVALTPALVLLVSLQRPIFLLRIMLWTAIPLCVLWAHGLALLRPPPLFVLACLAVALLGLHALDTGHYGARRKPNWRAALTHIVEDWTDDSVILLLGGNEKRQVRYYFSRKTDPLRWRPYHNLGAGNRVEGIARKVGDHRTVWVIYRRQRRQTRIGRRYLEGRGRVVWRKHYGHGVHTLKYRLEPSG